MVYGPEMLLNEVTPEAQPTLTYDQGALVSWFDGLLDTLAGNLYTPAPHSSSSRAQAIVDDGTGDCVQTAAQLHNGLVMLEFLIHGIKRLCGIPPPPIRERLS